ncbi:MAG: pantoate--beta-alanine ligase [Chloroflexi bacterium]|nr:pantoate--beta-alanine ligase [Chloroflexota bacterium]
MTVARTLADLRMALRSPAAPVGLVPTMGYLHRGHISLVEAARAECPTVVVSLFVNPTQFGPNEDFEDYPRDEDRDLDLLGDAGADIAFIPSVEEIYPAGDSTRVRVGGLTEVLEGERRPGHFEGVATVVAKLFLMVAPDRAYFGEKDAQQLAVLKRMTADMQFPIEVVGCPAVREPDGLALSSRNIYLTPEERAQAPALHAGLQAAVAAFENGVRDASALRSVVRDQLAAQPLAEIDYVSLADSETLAELEGLIKPPALLSLAVRFGAARLIDNVTLRA